MAKVRAQRRAERERRQREALERNAKRLRRKQFLRKATFYELRQRRRGRLYARRNRGERALIGLVGALVLVVIWTVLPSLALKVTASLIFLLVLPVLVLVVFDRRGN